MNMSVALKGTSPECDRGAAIPAFYDHRSTRCLPTPGHIPQSIALPAVILVETTPVVRNFHFEFGCVVMNFHHHMVGMAVFHKVIDDFLEDQVNVLTHRWIQC